MLLFILNTEELQMISIKMYILSFKTVVHRHELKALFPEFQLLRARVSGWNIVLVSFQWNCAGTMYSMQVCKELNNACSGTRNSMDRYASWSGTTFYEWNMDVALR